MKSLAFENRFGMIAHTGGGIVVPSEFILRMGDSLPWYLGTTTCFSYKVRRRRPKESNGRVNPNFGFCVIQNCKGSCREWNVPLNQASKSMSSAVSQAGCICSKWAPMTSSVSISENLPTDASGVSGPRFNRVKLENFAII